MLPAQQRSDVDVEARLATDWSQACPAAVLSDSALDIAGGDLVDLRLRLDQILIAHLQ